MEWSLKLKGPCNIRAEREKLSCFKQQPQVSIVGVIRSVSNVHYLCDTLLFTDQFCKHSLICSSQQALWERRGRCSPILQNVELPRDSPMAERLLESLDGLLTIEVSWWSLQYSRVQTPDYSLHRCVARRVLDSVCGEEAPRRQAFVSSSIHMPFLEVSPEREVFLLEKNFILDTQLWWGESFDKYAATFWILLKEEFLSQATGSSKMLNSRAVGRSHHPRYILKFLKVELRIWV